VVRRVNNDRLGSRSDCPSKCLDVGFKVIESTRRVITFAQSPMCQYSAVDGHMTDWHLVHLGGFATRGAGAIILEATAVTPEGRITPECTGIWSDTHIAPMKRVVDFAHGQGTAIGIQLAHAGRKASTLAPWVQARREHAAGQGSESVVAREVEGGWPANVVGPSDIPFADNYPTPKPLSVEGIKDIVQAYVDAVERCKKIGCEFSTLSRFMARTAISFIPSTLRSRINGQTSMAALYQIVSVSRSKLLARSAKCGINHYFFRLSATDWAKEEKNASGEWVSWGIEQTIELSKLLSEEGVDLVDVSSGGNYLGQQIAVGPGYQVPFAKQIKESLPNLSVASVGLITDPRQSEEILASGSADVLLYARELLRHVDFPLFAAQELGVAVKPADQYERAWGRMLTPKK
ncbi:unnamed protein product, partial [Rhizoctonia solani]